MDNYTTQNKEEYTEEKNKKLQEPVNKRNLNKKQTKTGKIIFLSVVVLFIFLLSLVYLLLKYVEINQRKIELIIEKEKTPLEKMIDTLNGETVVSMHKKIIKQLADGDEQRRVELTTKDGEDMSFTIPEHLFYPQNYSPPDYDCFKEASEYLEDLDDLDGDGKCYNSDGSKEPCHYLIESQINEQTLTCAGKREEREGCFVWDISSFLALNKYEECLLENFNSEEDPRGDLIYKRYYFEELAESLAARFVLGSIIDLYITDDPGLCDSPLVDGEMKIFCKKFDRNEIIKKLKMYYEISGVLEEFKERYNFMNSLGFTAWEFNMKNNDEYIEKKMTALQINKKFNECSRGSDIKKCEEYNKEKDKTKVDYWVEPIQEVEDYLNFGIISALTDMESRIKSDLERKGNSVKRFFYAFLGLEIIDNPDISISQKINVHPEKGVRFSRNGIIDIENDLTLAADEIDLALENIKKIYTWGKDNDGKDLKMALGEYFKKYLYNVNFSSSDVNTYYYNESTTSPKNINEVYPNSRFIEYYSPGTLDSDSNQLWFIWEVYDNNWYLTGVVHNGTPVKDGWTETVTKESDTFKLLVEAASPILDYIVFENGILDTSNWIEEKNEDIGYIFKYPKNFFDEAPEIFKILCNSETVTECPSFEGKTGRAKRHGERSICSLKSREYSEEYYFGNDYYTIGFNENCLTLHLKYREKRCDEDDTRCSVTSNKVYEAIIFEVVDSFRGLSTDN